MTRNAEPLLPGPSSRRELEDLYLRSWPACAALLQRYPELSNPVLLDVPDGYPELPLHVLIVGQESGPSRWCPEVDVRRARSPRAAVVRLMGQYRSFMAGLDPRVGHFWRFVRRLEAGLGVPGGGALWTNLNKCDLAGRRPRGLEADLARALPVLREELRVTRPDVVVFLTGPAYDPLLTELTGARVEPLPGWRPAAFARVQGDVLPRASYRIYHPNYLLRFCGSLGERVVRAVVAAARRSVASGSRSPRPRARPAANPNLRPSSPTRRRCPS